MGLLLPKLGITIAMIGITCRLYATSYVTPNFQTSVYPFLKSNCRMCHESNQKPYHSSTNLDTAYNEAKPFLNLVNPSLSELWIRSYNNHCKIPELCGKKEEAFLQALQSWAESENIPAVIESSLFGNSQVRIPEKIGEFVRVAFESVDGNTISFEINRLGSRGGDVFVIGKARFYGNSSNIALDGLIFNSKNAEILQQNFINFNFISKPTSKEVSMTLEGSGSVLFRPSINSTGTIDLELRVRNWKSNISRPELKSLFQNGYYLPVEQFEMGKIKAIIAGHSDETCTLDTKEQLQCWGWKGAVLGTEEQLERGTLENLMGPFLPTINLSLGTNAIKKLVMGDRHYCALGENSILKCWGFNFKGQLGVSKGNGTTIGDSLAEMGPYLLKPAVGSFLVNDVTVSDESTCALFANGKVKCWGGNDWGQLGFPSTGSVGLDSSQMSENLPFLDLGEDVVIKIAGGKHSHCVILKSGRVKCWGGNQFGQLGIGDTRNRGLQQGEMGRNLPYVDLGVQQKAIDLTMGELHTCVLFESGRVKCFGDNSEGQLGTGDSGSRGASAGSMGASLPWVNLGNFQVSTITSGRRHNCALSTDEKLKCWGSGVYGQLGYENYQSIGQSSTQMGDRLPPVNLGKRTVTKISAGNGHTCIVDSAGSATCWGLNASGQLGLGSKRDVGGEPNTMGENLKNIQAGFVSFLEN